MKQRLADYIADFLVQNGVTDCFSVVGGGAMHLNDAFGHKNGFKVTYNHHEQASAMAAEAYARVNNNPALVCVTTGPGATNAITGVAGAWMDSIPMIVISGQARYETTVYASGLNLRTRGVQEFDIIGSVKNMTKYCELVLDPNSIRYCLEKALYLSKNGRPGPCWLDIPLDVQAAIIETDGLRSFDEPKIDYSVKKDDVLAIIEKLKAAKRPLIFAGNGIRLSNAHDYFLELVNKLGVPVVTGMGSIDAIETDNPYYIGRNGTTGNRAGNFAIQTCDLLLSLGSRQSFFQTGFNYKEWAPEAFKIVNDIDGQELEKNSINAHLKVCCDVKDLIIGLLEEVRKIQLPSYDSWIKKCTEWKRNYPVVLNKHYEDEQANIYAFYNEMTRLLPSDANLVVSVGTSRVAGSQASYIKKGQRFFTNPSMAAMGFDLPAAVGVSVASKNPVVLVTGDGSFQMNIQEMQTIVHNNFPVKIFLMNNQGYHSIRMTQTYFFNNTLVGVGSDSGDISFPDLSKLVPAYGMKYFRIENNQMKDTINDVLSFNGPCLCEVMLSTRQITEPKVSSKRLPNGQMVSGRLDDMAPFLSEEEKNSVLLFD